MTQKAIVYHLGAHKTASSLIQKYMRDNPEVLESHGLVYLARSEMNDLVGWGKRLLKRPQLLEDRIVELLAGPHHTLVTSHENTLGPPFRPGGEHLYPRGPEIAVGLARVLDRWPDARVILYIRPQDEFVESYYLQRIHQGDQITFAEWLEQIDLDAVSWLPVVDALTRHLGEERVQVVDFGRIRQGQNAFLADFFARIDPSLGIRPEYRPVRNPSISGKGLAIALAANRFLRTDLERKALRTFLQRHFSNRRYPRPVLFTDDQKAEVRRRYASEYERLTGTPLVPTSGVRGDGA